MSVAAEPGVHRPAPRAVPRPRQIGGSRDRLPTTRIRSPMMAMMTMMTSFCCRSVAAESPRSCHREQQRVTTESHCALRRLGGIPLADVVPRIFPQAGRIAVQHPAYRAMIHRPARRKTPPDRTGRGRSALHSWRRMCAYRAVSRNIVHLVTSIRDLV